MKSAWVWLIALALVLANQLQAQDAGQQADKILPESERPSISSHVSPPSVVVGQPVTLGISVLANAGDEVLLPSQSFAPFELHAQRTSQAVEGGKTRYTFTLELLTFEVGEQTIAPVLLQVVTRDGHLGTEHTTSHRISVTSLIANEPNAQPKPATDPVSVLVTNTKLLYGLSACGIILLLFGLVWWFWKRRKSSTQVAVQQVQRLPWDEALDGLRQLQADRDAMFAAGQGAVWVDRLTDVLRHYLGIRFGFDGLECTSDEMVTQLAHSPCDADTRTHVTAFLVETDLIKFAKVQPDAMGALAWLEQVRQIITLTIPLPSTETSEGAKR